VGLLKPIFCQKNQDDEQQQSPTNFVGVPSSSSLDSLTAFNHKINRRPTKPKNQKEKT